MRYKYGRDTRTLGVYIFLLIAIGLGIGYAVLTERLSLETSVNYNSMNWDVGFSEATDGNGTVQAVPSISPDKKSISVTCDLGTSTKSETCIAKATIKNDSTFDVELITEPLVTFNTTYIDTVDVLWSSDSSKVNALDKVESLKTRELIIKIVTKQLSEDLLPEDELNVPVSVTMNWIEAGNQYTEDDYITTLTNLTGVSNYSFHVNNTGYVVSSDRTALISYINKEILKDAISIEFIVPEGVTYSRQLFNKTWNDYTQAIPSSQTIFNDSAWQTTSTTIDLTEYPGAVTFGMAFKGGFDKIGEIVIKIKYSTPRVETDDEEQSYGYNNAVTTLNNVTFISNYSFHVNNTGYVVSSERAALISYIDQEILKGATSITFNVPEGVTYSRQLFNKTWNDYTQTIPSSQTVFNDSAWQTTSTTIDLTEYPEAVTFGMSFKGGFDIMEQTTITITYDYDMSVSTFTKPIPTTHFDTTGWLTTTPQSSVVYGDYMFILYDGGESAVLDMKTKEVISSFKLPNAHSNYHASNVSFGTTIVEGSNYPALYVNKTLGNSECFVYALHQTDNEFSAELIQTITFDDSQWGNPSGNNYRDFLADDTGQYMYIIGYYDYKASGNYTIIKKVAMPSLSQETVNLTNTDVLDSFDVPAVTVIQGTQVKDGLIFIGNNSGSNPLGICVVDLVGHKQIANFNLSGYISEVEGVSFYNDEIYVQDVGHTIFKLTFTKKN